MRDEVPMKCVAFYSHGVWHLDISGPRYVLDQAIVALAKSGSGSCDGKLSVQIVIGERALDYLGKSETARNAVAKAQADAAWGEKVGPAVDDAKCGAYATEPEGGDKDG